MTAAATQAPPEARRDPPDATEAAADAGEIIRVLRLRARVGADGRLEVASSHLTPGQEVEVRVYLNTPPSAGDAAAEGAGGERAATGGKPGLVEWLRSLPPNRWSEEEWEEFERDFRQGRGR